MKATQSLTAMAFPESLSTLFEIDGSGRLIIVNTGGSSAGEGGMGSSSDDDTAKGDLSKPGEKSGTKNGDNSDDKWDPIGKNIKEKEKDADND